MEPQKESSLGNFLKGEREKQGLSQDQVAQITRLRQNFLSALENEDLDNLPPPVFVKGFIRSYAQAVGFDAKKAIDLYEKIAPAEEKQPKPLIGYETSKRKTEFFLIPLILVVASIIVIYILEGHDLILQCSYT